MNATSQEPSAPFEPRALLDTAEHLLVHPAGELYIKSQRTRRRFKQLLVRNLKVALKRLAPGAVVVSDGTRLHVLSDDLDAAWEAASLVFGVQRIERVSPIAWTDLEDLATKVADRARESVRGKTFAVRVKRSGNQSWGSPEAAALIGSRLFEASGGVNLKQPEVEVKVDVFQDKAFLVEKTGAGPSGLPIGAQERTLSLMSGGFDSPVASWLLLRRGSPLDFVHFKLECSASEHALLVTQALAERWCHGHEPVLWMIDFQPIKEALLRDVQSSLRQVVLKQLMIACADALARRLGMHALVTGESVGQVSSQTISHLAAIDQYANRAVLRPLAGSLKEEIIARAKEIGTDEMSARAQEVCDLSDGPVAVAARWARLDRAHEELPPGLVEAALASLELVPLIGWFPGMEPIPVVAAAPEGVPLVTRDAPVPETGPIAVRGGGAPALACRLARRGRKVWLVQSPANRGEVIQ